ncbi:rhomboid family intramembrane serine protease [Candidatus Pacearchaeota archaeon]|nr:rhomboid family intramembrane serine protease [Candidatus Pacearchaeota archaeon]
MAHVYKISNKKRSKLSLTTQLILVNVVLYIVGLVLLSIYGEDFILENVALTPAFVLSGQKIWTLVTSIFMHGSFFHIFANMFSLFFIGSFLERIIGKKRFFWTYIIAGLVGGLFFIASGLIFNDLNTPAVGASGAIFGLLGVLAVVVPFSKVYLIVGPLLLIVAQVLVSEIIPGSMLPMFNTVINILIILMIFSLFSFNSSLRKIAVPLELPMWLLPIIAIVPLTIIGFFIPLPIGNSAHLGGLVVGLVYGFYLKKKFPNKTRSISRHFR